MKFHWFYELRLYKWGTFSLLMSYPLPKVRSGQCKAIDIMTMALNAGAAVETESFFQATHSDQPPNLASPCECLC